MFIVVVVTFVAGFISFKHGDATDKLIFVTYAISCVLGLPTLLKDMSKEYTGKPEPMRFVRNRFVAYAIASAALSLGTFWLITLTTDNVALLSESLGGSHRWWIAILLAIYWVLFMAIELFMFYLPQRLGYEDEYDSEEEESKANKEATTIGVIAAIFIAVAALLPRFVPAIYDYISSGVYDIAVVVIAAVGIIVYLLKRYS
jgi:hypothetical protein